MLIPVKIPSAAARPFDLVGFGENSVDFIAVTDLATALPAKRELQHFERLPGGQIATAVAACSRLGWRTRYLGSFGDDDLGRLAEESLSREGVNTTGSRRVAGASTRIAVILVDAQSGERHVLWHRDATLRNAWASHSDSLVEGATSGRLLLVDGDDVPAATLAVQAARRQGIPTMIDIDAVQPGISELLRDIDVIVASETLPSALVGVDDLRRALDIMEREYGPALMVVTLGGHGSLARCAGVEIRSPAFRVDAVDTTGAGDVFRGGLAAAFLRRPAGSLEEALNYANAAAALNCRGLGARGGLPGPDEVDRLLASQPR